MFWRMLVKSSFHRPPQLVWTLTTLAACAALITLFVTVGVEIRARMTSAFARLGANAVVRPARNNENEAVPAGEEHVWRTFADMTSQWQAAAAVIHVRIGLVHGLPLAFAASPPRRLARLTPYWQVEGARAESPSECLAGRRVATRLGLHVGDSVPVRWESGGAPHAYRVEGILDSGDSDESRIFVTSFSPSGGASAEATTQNGETSYALLLLPGTGVELARFARALDEKHIPLQVAPLGAIAHGEQTILTKVELLCSVTLVAVLALTVLGLSVSVLARLIERSREISLMRALGAEGAWLVRFLAVEAALQGAVAALCGYAVGTTLAGETGRRIFGVSFVPSVWALGAAVLTTVLVYVSVSALAGLRALRMESAKLLRCE